MRPIPVILDTDIGSDIDDTWALAFLLRCPELDVRLVTSATGNTEFRARLIAKFLQTAGRTDVAVGVGLKQSGGDANQGEWIAGYRLSDYPGRVYADGVEAMIATVMDSPTPVTLIGIAPGTNIAEALRHEPRLADNCVYVGMNGSLAAGVEGIPGSVAEHNVVSDLAASRAIFSAPWEMTITPLDSCGVVVLRGENYRRVERSEDVIARALVENYDAWWAGHPVGRTTVLFDTVAVYLAFARDLLVMRDLGICVTEEGYTQVDDGAKRMSVATGWRDLAAFEDLLVARLTAGAPASHPEG